MKNYRLPDEVYRIVVAEFADYDRKKQYLNSLSGRKKIEPELISSYTQKIIAIDSALLSVCRGESASARLALRCDIANGRGYRTSSAKQYYSTHTIYTKRKSDVIFVAACALGYV